MKVVAKACLLGLMGVLFCCAARLRADDASPLRGGDTESATRQYKAAVAMQNREAYDLAADAWVKFIEGNRTDSRVDRAFHYLGVCYFRAAVGSLEAKQIDAGRKSLDSARQCFETIAKSYPKFDLMEESTLFLGLAQFKRAEIDAAESSAASYDAAAATLDTFIKNYPQSKFLAQILYTRGDCAYHRDQKADAARFYAQALTKAPDDKLAPEIMYALGVTQEALKQPTEAGKTYDDFYKKFSSHHYANEVIMRRGETLFAIGQFGPAAEWLGAAAARPGFDSADYATMRQAVALAKSGKSGPAGELLASIFTKFPSSTRFSAVLKSGHALARGLMHDNHPAEALAMVEKLLPHAEGRDEAVDLAMDRADAIAAIPARRAESVALYAAVATKFPKHPAAPQAMYLAAYGAMTQGDFPATLRYADAFLAAYPKHELLPDVLYVSAESRLQLGKYDEAEKLYAELLQKYPKHADADAWLVRQGTSLQMQKKYADVVAVLQPVVGRLHNADMLAEAQFLIGSGRAEQKQFAEAIPSLEASLAAQPKWRQADEALLALGNAYYRQKNSAKANEVLRKLVADFPASKVLDRAHYRLGQYAAAANDAALAATEYAIVCEKWPASPLVPHALHGRGWALFDQNKFKEAEDAFDALVEKHAGHELKIRGNYARGLARHQLGKYADAVADLQAVVESPRMEQGEKSDARYVLGLCQAGLKKHGDAAATFRTLLKEDPKYAAADKVYYELGWALKEAGQEKESAAAFAELVKQCPGSSRVAESQFLVGEANYKDGKFQSASTAYSAALEKAGKTELGEKSAHKLGWAYYRLDNAAEAQQAFGYQRANWPQGPLVADATFMEAECLFKQKKYSEALTAYDRVKDPSAEEFRVLTLLHKAQALGQTKPPQEAERRATWQKSLDALDKLAKEYPKTSYLPEALYERGWALQNLDRQDEAMGEYQQVLGKSNGEAAARAQFMIGELQFQQKKHAEAVKSFFLVIYGYPFPQWQGDAAYEAARCFEVLKKKTQAIKQYQELVDKFPQSDKVPLAKERIKTLQN